MLFVGVLFVCGVVLCCVGCLLMLMYCVMWKLIVIMCVVFDFLVVVDVLMYIDVEVLNCVLDDSGLYVLCEMLLVKLYAATREALELMFRLRAFG